MLPISIVIWAVAGYFYYRFIDRRLYKEVDGKLYVKEGIGEWHEISEHLKTKHKYNKADIDDLIKYSKTVKRDGE